MATMTLIDALNLAIRHLHQGQAEDAERICRELSALRPEVPEIWHILALALNAGEKTPAAMRSLQRAAAVRPDFADAYSNIGVLRQRTGLPGLALNAHDQAIRLRPDFAETYSNRGSCRLEVGDRAGALADFAQAIRLKPDFAQAFNNLGVALRQDGRSADAAAMHRRATALEPGFVDACLQLGHAMREQNRPADAGAAYAAALRLDPKRSEALGYLLYLKQTMCDWSDFDALCARARQVIDDDAGILIPLATLSIHTTLEQQFRSAKLFYSTAVRRPEVVDPPPPPRPPAGRRLRIGYFSADFHEHATAYLAAEMFELHDRDRFEVTAYSFGPDDGSPMRRRLEAAFHRFRDIRAMGLDAVARQVADDGVDIMIDVKTYTRGSRLDLLSRRLAPVQATYLAYPGTIGGGFMDYIIGDPVVTPMEHQPFYSERIIQLPDAYQCNDRRRPIAATPSRADCGLPEQGFVFCCFNTAYKILPDIFAAWMRLLRATPGSVLWLYLPNAMVADNLRRQAAAQGVAPDRLVFASNRPLPEHLARYRLADLFVDTFPYTGHTTTSDSLWAGLPVLTMEGGTFASRVASSLLQAVGLPELITRSLAEYEALALRLVNDPDLLGGLRRRLADNRLTAPLFDSRRFTRHMEAAFTTMWDIHCRGGAPQPFAVPVIDG